MQSVQAEVSDRTRQLEQERAGMPAAEELDQAIALLQACRSLELLAQRAQGTVRLTVLSAQATSDPHALDSGPLCSVPAGLPLRAGSTG